MSPTTSASTTDHKAESVLVAMSGGVDSSVCALLVRDSGYKACGITLDLFDERDASCNETAYDDEPTRIDAEDACRTGKCSSAKDAADALCVCERLGIPHLVRSYAGEFATQVIERFCDGYINAQTPNPCVDCNRYVKFATIQDARRKLGYDYMATGHYARREYDEKTGRYLLKRAVDENKDQTYFLFHLTQDDLAHTLFPLGELDKPTVRKIASENGFVNAEKPESQDICFIKDGNYADFIRDRRNFTFEEGPILDRSGKRLGTHTGLIDYTVGQRKGIGVAAPEPLYVFEKDPVRNALVVGTNSETLCTEIHVEDVNFVGMERLDEPIHLTVKTHYRQTPRGAVVEQISADKVVIRFDEPQRACAPGQAAVVYDDDSVVCGGTIVINHSQL